jgi:hypothetical protein
VDYKSLYFWGKKTQYLLWEEGLSPGALFPTFKVSLLLDYYLLVKRILRLKWVLGVFTKHEFFYHKFSMCNFNQFISLVKSLFIKWGTQTLRIVLLKSLSLVSKGLWSPVFWFQVQNTFYLCIVPFFTVKK